MDVTKSDGTVDGWREYYFLAMVKVEMVGFRES
jgi:hypothetical protein